MEIDNVNIGSVIKWIITVLKSKYSLKINLILSYFKIGITNPRTEAFNNVAKTLKKGTYGYLSFNN
ncbi:MAG: transposase [Bdellovibrionales bacterium]|nr:transposase [Bdellovibrionales bacterium]